MGRLEGNLISALLIVLYVSRDLGRAFDRRRGLYCKNLYKHKFFTFHRPNVPVDR
jgi:hypothetical protein